jgi:hypothetical protein
VEIESILEFIKKAGGSSRFLFLIDVSEQLICGVRLIETYLFETVPAGRRTLFDSCDTIWKWRVYG